MQYRPFGKTGWQVSALGIGTMRLPVIDELKNINEPLAFQVIRRPGRVSGATYRTPRLGLRPLPELRDTLPAENRHQ
jgi:hypothetical protein